jgi:hypothetical protein
MQANSYFSRYNEVGWVYHCGYEIIMKKHVLTQILYNEQ